MRRAGLILALAAAVAALPGASALGADKNVAATSDPDLFKPAEVTINKGDTVTWHSDGGTPHNVHFKNGTKLGGAPATHTPTATTWTDQFTFNTAGTFKYWCDEHSDGTFGMVGKVVVKDPNGDTKPKVTNLAGKPAAFCTNKSDTCDKAGTKVKFTLSEAAKVTGQIKPKDTDKPFVTIFKDRQKPAGKNSINYAGKGLKPRKYVLRVRGKDAAGNVGNYVKTTVRVVKNG
jgi:plastocyanin